MKKTYSKPQIHMESFAMDRSIAANCIADFDDMQALIAVGAFGDNDRGITCGYTYEEGPHDTICYHSNVQTAFLS